MSLTRPFAWMAVLTALVLLAKVTGGQEFHNAINPFMEVDSFKPDLQFFAPAEVGSFGGGDPPNTGFYFTYDRIYSNMSRPDGDISMFEAGDGDFGWGNRVDAGYMTDDKIGWGISVWHLDGPNELQGQIQERLGRFNDDDDPPGSGDEPLLQDRNPRIYEVANSLNVAKFTSFELNRVWRRKEFHNGAVLEPFLGVRYLELTDFGRADNYHRFDEDADGNPDTSAETFEGPWEIFTANRNTLENSMLGGQLGVRLHKQAGHWLLSGEFRAIAAQNWQFLTAKSNQILTRSDFGEGSEPDMELRFNNMVTSDNSEFVWGGEIRGEAAYELTRDISLRAGFFLIDLGQGVGRSFVFRPFPGADTALGVRNNQDVQMGGVTFGITVNR